MEDVKRLIGNRIRELRKARGLSQEKLAHKSELHYTHIGAIERGEKNWSIDTLVKVVRGLDVEISQLFNFPISTADTRKVRKSLIEAINKSAPETVKIMSDLLIALESLKRPSA